MDKPISIMINETRISLVDICNKSTLPPCILEPIVKDLYNGIKRMSAIQLKQDTETYNQTKAQTNESVTK